MLKSEPLSHDDKKHKSGRFRIVKDLFDRIKEANLTDVDVTSDIEKLKHNSRISESGAAYNFLCESGIVGFVRDLVATPRDEYFQFPLFENILGLANFLCDASENCAKIRDAVIETGLEKIYCRDLKHSVILGSCFMDENEQISEEYGGTEGHYPAEYYDDIGGEEATTAFFAVLYNILRHSPNYITVLRKEGLVDICLKYLKCNISTVKATALIVLSFAADLDENSEIVQATESNIQFIIQNLLQQAIDSDTRRNKYGYTAEELTESVTRLAKNYNNAVQMIKLGIVQIASNNLQDNVNESEVKWTLRLLWSLSFLAEAQSEIKSNDELISSISVFSNHKNPEFFNPAKGILWELELIKSVEKDKNSEESIFGASEILSNSETHIMISYCWAQQPVALQIFDRLKKNGKKVWIDVEKMEGDSLEKMAEAVEKSQVVICCFSEDYSNSQACRSEATYAYKQKKKMVFAKVQPDFEPKGWLGLILGAEIYYQLFDDCEFEKYFSKLMKFIEGKRAAESMREEKFDEADTISVAVNNQIPSSDKKEPDYKQWSEREVLKWAYTLGFLEDVKETTIGKLNGQNLHELRIWQKTATTFFLSFCKDNLNIQGAKSLIEFSAALRQLK